MPVDQGFIHSLGGYLVVAAYLNWALLGILFLQTFAYYVAFPRDRPLVKTLVSTVLALEIAQTAITSHDVYVALAGSIGDADPSSAIDDIYNHWFSIPVAGGITGGIGQLFFAYRLWMISKTSTAAFQLSTRKTSQWGTPVIIGTLAVASLVSAMIAASTFFHAETFSTLLGQEGNGVFGSMASIGVWNGIGAICDIVIALSMPYYLMRHGTGLPPTHIMVVKLVRLIIETGILTAIVAITHLCLYFGNSSAFIIPGLIVSKFYANTMLVILNNRMQLVAGPRTQDESRETLNPPQSPMFRNPETSRTRQKSTVFVSNDRLTFRLNDIPTKPKPMMSSLSRVSGDMASDRTSSRTAVDLVEKSNIKSFDPTQSGNTEN